jgi:hypothetical protein
MQGGGGQWFTVIINKWALVANKSCAQSFLMVHELAKNSADFRPLFADQRRARGIRATPLAGTVARMDKGSVNIRSGCCTGMTKQQFGAS